MSGVILPPKTESVNGFGDIDRLDKPIHAERHVSVIAIGAGASGLLLAYKIQKHFQNVSLTVYEKNAGLSGTWFENRYPGCACDVPSHNYTWSFEPKLDWTAVYAGSGEILNYFTTFAHKYELGKYIKTQHQVIGAYWDNSRQGYHVKIKDLVTGQDINDFCNILINASGILNNWRYPAIPGLDKYKGKLLHTANWDVNTDLKDLHVGLIGNGSSGIQVLPAIQPIVKQLTTFIREATYVSPIQGFEQHVYTDQEKVDFAVKEGALLEYRRNIERGINGQFDIFLKGTELNKAAHDFVKGEMVRLLNNKTLEEQLIPDWHFGCRRLTPGIGYLETLSKENVKVVYGEIVHVTENGCVLEDGTEHPTDVLICATGFDTSFKPRFPVVGPHGKNLQDVWANNPESYLGIAAADYPNYLIFLGPNCPIGNGAVLAAIEAQADYMCKFIDHYQTHNITQFSPRKEAIDDFVAHKEWFMDRTVWNDPCRSWYKSAGGANETGGKITALWPGSSLHYMEALRGIRHEDWEFKYSGNRFAYLGNGRSQCEADNGSDWGYYIREHDDGTPLSLRERNKILNKAGGDENRNKEGPLSKGFLTDDAEPGPKEGTETNGESHTGADAGLVAGTEKVIQPEPVTS